MGADFKCSTIFAREYYMSANTNDNIIVNRVANSSLITLDLEELFPNAPRMEFDLAPMLYQGIVLKEMDFREAVKNYAWENFKGAIVSVFCSADAIVPTWAYMLIAIKLAPIARFVGYGSAQEVEAGYFREALNVWDLEQYRDKKIIVKGCSKHPIPTDAFIELTRRLTNIAQSIMYGEPCSNVPLFKKPLLRTKPNPND